MLDSGTGKNSLALKKYFSLIDHIDLSQVHHNFLKKKIKDLNIHNISTKTGDLEKVQLKKNYYDFINLDGVIMHSKSPQKILENIFNSLKQTGTVKILIYKKGSFKFILIEFLREIIKTKKIIIKNPYKKFTYNWLFEDDLYVPYIRLYEDSEILNFFIKKGIKNIKYKNVNLTKSIDTQNFHHSASFFLSGINKNTKNFKLKFKSQLDVKFLKQDKFFYKNCGKLLIKILKNKKKLKNSELLNKTLIEIYKISNYKIMYSSISFDKAIQMLKKQLNNLLNLY